MRERSKGYIGQIVDGKKLAVIANGIYNLQYSSDFSECTVDNLLFVTLDEKNVFGDNAFSPPTSASQLDNGQNGQRNQCSVGATAALLLGYLPQPLRSSPTKGIR